MNKFHDILPERERESESVCDIVTVKKAFDLPNIYYIYQLEEVLIKSKLRLSSVHQLCINSSHAMPTSERNPS